MNRFKLAVILFLLTSCLVVGCSPQKDFSLAEPGPYEVGTLFVRAYKDSSRSDRAVNLTIWYPGVLPEGQEPADTNMNIEPDLQKAPYPLILSSSTTGYTAFGNHLASYGFVVAGVNGMNPYDPWGDKLIDYPLDILFALEQLASNPPEGLAGVIDTDNAGVIGYSFDGYNALALSGARVDPEFYRNYCANLPEMPPGLAWWPKYICAPAEDWDAFADHAGEALTNSNDGLWLPMTDERIRAAIPMGVEGYALFGDQGLAPIDIPVMILHATADEGNFYPFEAVPIFEALHNPDKVMISFIDEGHMMIFDEEPVHRMCHFAVAFFGYHLQGNSEFAKFFDETYVDQYDDLAWGVYDQ
ncbi:MAG: hypothetical protein V2J07_07970 [Anaerolineae bacterium]|jgi:predicted dienelactone hydrolase|nr:hypothetical protein [Anaerolineae bacterium]